MAIWTAILSAIVASLLLVGGWPFFYWYYLTPRRIRRAMEKQGIRGPTPRFLVGNLPEIAALVSKSTADDMRAVDHDIVGRLFPHYLLWSKLYGKRFVFWYGSEPRLCLTESEMIKEFLSAKHVQTSGKSWLQQQGSKHFIGRGLLMANGDDWLRQRHVVAPAFMGEKLKSQMGFMVECTKKCISALSLAAAEGTKEVEVGEYLTKLTGDIISRTEFDSNYEKGKQIFNGVTRLQRLTAQSSKHLWIPANRFIPSKFRREIKMLKKQVEKLLMEIIDCRRYGVEIGRSSTYGKGLLGILLAETAQKKEGLSYTLDLVMDECKTFFFAGHETSALLLTWTLMLLASNPDWQQRARSEVRRICGSDLPPTADQLPKLTLLQMIINESLRLYPPATLLPRMAFEDTRLGDLFIPKGLSIWIPVLAIHHDQEIWGKDAHLFNPDRFATRSFALTRHFFPFASGPRNCVGQAYAMMEAKVILAMLLTSFSFTISENYRHAPVNVLTLKPKYGVPVYLKPLLRS